MAGYDEGRELDCSHRHIAEHIETYLLVFLIEEHPPVAGHDLNINIVLRHQMIYCIWCERGSTLPYSFWILSAVEGVEVNPRVTGKWSGDVPYSE